MEPSNPNLTKQTHFPYEILNKPRHTIQGYLPIESKPHRTAKELEPKPNLFVYRVGPLATSLSKLTTKPRLLKLFQLKPFAGLTLTIEK